MNLLPKSHKEFSETNYWDAFFKKRGNKAFEWYGEYYELSQHIHKYIKKQDVLLITGCGNSTIGQDLFDLGYSNITNIDISQVVIRQMRSQNEKQRPGLRFLEMDALNTTFQNEEFSVIFDKGTLDALMPDSSKETLATINKYFSEILRILKLGGRYVCISLLQEHILKIVLDFFTMNNFMVRIERCYEAEKKAVDNGEKPMPVFMIICTKCKILNQIFVEINLTSSDKKIRCSSTQEAFQSIKSAQDAHFICSGLQRTSIADEREVSMDLFQPGEKIPRFSVFIVDVPNSKNQTPYAAFLVPQGREAEWLFSTEKGRKQITALTNHGRLAIITMHRGQNYGSYEEIQNELSETICNFSPPGYTNPKIKFLSMDSGTGKREIKYEGESKISGKYVIEDVLIDNEKYRRLYFLSSQFVIQSETKFKKIKTRRGQTKEFVDLTYLSCKHHNFMTLGVYCATKKKSENCKIGLIGLGGGGLCSFLGQFLPQIIIEAVDIDEEMLKIAENFFGLTKTPKLKVIIQDGLKYLEENSAKGITFDAILFDVDSKDTSIGLSCPPKQFLDPTTLNNVKKILTKDGIFVLNLVIRDDNLKPGIIEELKKHFNTILSYKLEEDLNEIFYCTGQDLDNLKIRLKEANINFCKFTKSKDDLFDDFDKEFKIY